MWLTPRVLSDGVAQEMVPYKLVHVGGLTPEHFQTRATRMWLTPRRLASNRVDQQPPVGGFSCSVAFKMAASSAGDTNRGRPALGRSAMTASKPPSWNRERQRATVCESVSKKSAIRSFDQPSEARRMMDARRPRRESRPTFRRQRCNASRSELEEVSESEVRIQIALPEPAVIRKRISSRLG